MATDPESADLIESLLAEDEGRLEESAESDAADDPDDSDYEARPTRKKQRSSKARAKKRQVEGSEGSRRRRKDTAQRAPSRFWTEEEEIRFLEALELYGRDWKQCAAFVETRDKRALESHAQKHFIKLCLQGKPLPEKVAASGSGYTLSGKPLDPRSGTAQSYGFTPDTVKDMTPEQLEVVKAGIVMEALEMDPSQDSTEATVKTHTSAGSADRPVGSEAKVPSSGHKPTGRDESWEYLKNMRTDYALNRPQRAAARNRRVQMGTTSESIQLVECQEFMSSPGAATGVAQPFTIDISAEVLFLMDFHAHLSDFEIIGLMAGKWDGDRKHLTISEGMPCHRVQGSEARTSVELDPASEVQARTEMVEKGLVGSGWYHSHPVFSATPSLKDIENQRNYQTLFRNEASSVEPFVGWIVSPYDSTLPSPRSRMCGFYVLEQAQGIKPFRLRFNVINKMQRCCPNLLEKCENVLHMIRSESSRMDLLSVWRDWTYLRDTQQMGEPLTKIAKLKLSLMSYFAEDCMEEAKRVGRILEGKIEEIWDLQLTAGKTDNDKAAKL